MKHIFLINGLKQSGKDTFANVLVKEFGFKKLSYASYLKELSVKIIPIIFPDCGTYFLGTDLFENEKFKAKIIPSKFNKNKLTFRGFLQTMGTDYLRKYINNDYHTDFVIEEALRDVTKNYVISDFRFPNESSCWQSHLDKFIVSSVRIERDSIEKKDLHESETALDDYPELINFVIKNNGTLEEFNENAKYFFKNYICDL